MAMLHDNSILSTVRMEHQVLKHIKDAMRVTLNWDAPDVSLPRKLSSLQFTMKSFQRHLERVMNIEEEGGYMAEVVEVKPYLQDRIELLERDHARFRALVRALVPELDQISDWDQPRFAAICDEVRALIDDVDRHGEREFELLQESVVIDDGGEG